RYLCLSLFFLFNATPPPQLYTLSLHDALPISDRCGGGRARRDDRRAARTRDRDRVDRAHRARARAGGRAARLHGPGERDRGRNRSEEHTSELQSLRHLVCRLLLEKKKIEINHV